MLERLEVEIIAVHLLLQLKVLFFFFNDTATTEIYTLSLHDALPISLPLLALHRRRWRSGASDLLVHAARHGDRKSTRLNSSHSQISYAVFCLKKKNLSLSFQVSIILSNTASNPQ